MMRRLLAPCIAAMALTAAPSLAQQPPPPAHGDALAGKQLVEKDCVACHTRRFGDAATIYTRADRKVRTAAQLLAQVQFCNVELKAGYFPEEEEHVAAYLDMQYYKFKP
ncbi:MAG: cytochrome c [Casimicrobiaceae bacterium]